MHSTLYFTQETRRRLRPMIYAKKTATRPAKAMAPTEPVMVEAAPVNLGMAGLVEVPLDGLTGTPVPDAAGTVTTGLDGTTGTEVPGTTGTEAAGAVGTAGHWVTVTVTVTGPAAGADGAGADGAGADEAGTDGTTTTGLEVSAVGFGGETVAVALVPGWTGMTVLVNEPYGQLVMVGWQLVMVLTMVV